MRLAGIFAAFAEELIEGVEKCCQRFPGASRCNHQRMFASRRHMPGLRLDSGRLFKGATSRGLPVKTRPAGAMKGLDYLPLTLFPVNIMHDAWNSLTIDA